MKRIVFLTVIAALLLIGKISAQNVFNPTDQVYTYDPSKPVGDPRNPALPPDRVMAKWIRTTANSKVTFNTTMYKPYIWNGMPFRLLYPKTYQPGVNDGKKYPIVVFWHGGGEIAPITDNEIQLYNGGEFFASQVASGGFDGFFIFPQETMIGWENSYYSRVNSVLDSLQKYCKVDPDRIIIMGLSIGGVGSFDYASQYPKRAAKIIAASPSYIGTITPVIPSILQIPVWMASGGLDPQPDFPSMNAFNMAFKNAGGDVLFDFFPNDDHKTWNDQWSKPYFLTQLNSTHKANPLVYFQRNQLCPDSAINVRMALTAGFYAYQWEYNGSVIPGAVSSEYYGKQYGTYRARFQRTATSEWSAWSPSPVVVSMKAPYNAPAIQIAGLYSAVLPAVDGATTTPLTMPSGYQQYRWLNAGNTIISTSQVYNAPIGQYRASVMDQSGCFANYSPVFPIVDANGPNKPGNPKNLSATAKNANAVLLDWTSNSSGTNPATAFEIYRSTKPGGPYNFAGSVVASKLTFTDTNLVSNANYYYVVRAVNASAASGLSNEAFTLTQKDVQPPTAPSNLKSGFTTRQSIELSWDPSADNVGVYKYDIYLNGVKAYSTDSTKFVAANLTPQKPYVIVVKARDLAGNISQPSNQVNASSALSGLKYKYYQGYYYNLPDFNTLTPVKTGISSNIDISVRNSGVNDQFGFVWEGYISINTAGTYTFKLKSDDGSKLYMSSFYDFNATALINNDGAHDASSTKSATYNFPQAGIYPIAVAYFEQTGDQSIQLSYSGPGLTERVVPNSAFVDNVSPVGTVPSAPSGLSATANAYNRITLNWADNSSNESGFEVVRATNSAGPFIPLATTAAATTSYVDTTLLPQTIYYYKVRSVGTGGASAFTATASATTQALPTAPAAPSSLKLFVGVKQFTLNWTDNAATETGVEIFRSTNDISNYRLIATLAPNTTSYVDATIFPNVTYYYKVRAKVNGNNSAFSNEVIGKTINVKPAITRISDFTIKAGASFVLPVKASDADSDDLVFAPVNLPSFASVARVDNNNANITFNPPSAALGVYVMAVAVSDPFNGTDTTRFNVTVNRNSPPVLSAINNVTLDEGATASVNLTASDAESTASMVWTFASLPAFAIFTNNGNGNGTIAVAPGYADAGAYNVTAFVDDGFGGKDTQTFTITVNDKSPNTKWLVNIKYNTNAPSPWNNMVATGNNLLNTAGQSSTLGVTISAPLGLSLYSFGTSTGRNSGYYPDAVLIDNFYLSNGRDTGNILIRGLNPALTYNFRMMSATNNASENAASRTVFQIGNKKDSVLVKGNTTMTAYIAGISPDASGNVNMKWYRGTGAQTAYINGFEIESVFNDGAAPAKAQNISAIFIPAGGAKVMWRDVAYNETSYKVYRSANRTGPYNLLNPGASNQNDTSYLDATATPNSTYYYYVVAANSVGNSPSSDTVMLVIGNNPPVITAISDLYVKAGSSSSVSFSVSDDPGDVLTVTATNLPSSFVTLQRVGSTNTYNIVANASIDNVGFYNATINVTDDRGAVTSRKFNIYVSDNRVKTILVKFGGDGFVLPKPWNNVSNGWPGSGLKVSDMTDDSNAPTTIDLQLTTNFTGYFINGFNTVNNSGIVPDTVLYSGIYSSASTASPNTFKLLGLDVKKRYSIGFVSSINTGYDAGIVLSSGSQTVIANGRYNATILPRLNGLVPAADSSVQISVAKTSSSINAYINALIIQEYDPATLPYVSPSNLIAEPSDLNRISLTWSDRSDNEAAFEVWRSTVYGSGYTLIATVTANTTAYNDNNVTANTRYYYKVRAVNGANTSAYSNVASSISLNSAVYVNMKTTNPGGGKWNNTGKVPAAGDVFALNDALGFSTGYALTIVNNFTGSGNGGMTTGGRNTGVFPDSVLISNYVIAKGQTATVTLSNLDQSKRYRIGFAGSSNVFGNYNTAYSINDRTVYLNALYDTTKAVYIDDVIPNINGEITANIACTPDAANGLLNALVVQSYTYVPGGSETDNPVTSMAIKENKITLSEEKAVIKDSIQKRSVIVNAYPNPFEDYVNIDLDATSNIEKLYVEIYDSNGKLIYRRAFGNIDPGKNIIRIPAADLRMPDGFYFMHVHSNDGAANSIIKLIKLIAH